MAKSKKPSKTVLEYRRVRKNLLQNIRRLEERGYDVSKIDVPDIPNKITRRDINALKKLDKDRYKKATYEVEVIKNKGRKNERIEVTKVKGTKYHKQENKIRAEKAAATRKENRDQKIENYKNLQYERLLRDEIPYWEYVETTGEKIPSYEESIAESNRVFIKRQEEERLSILKNLGKWFNPETGEIREGIKPSEGNWYGETEAKEWYDQNIYQNVIKKVENMQIYEGKTKRSMQIKSNADMIRNKIEEEYKKNPKNVTRVLSEMESTGALDDVEIWYFAHGFNKFAYNFMMYLDLFDENGVINDEEEYTDYDE